MSERWQRSIRCKRQRHDKFYACTDTDTDANLFLLLAVRNPWTMADAGLYTDTEDWNDRRPSLASVAELLDASDPEQEPEVNITVPY